jgi:hypothetical protein
MQHVLATPEGTTETQLEDISGDKQSLVEIDMFRPGTTIPMGPEFFSAL